MSDYNDTLNLYKQLQKNGAEHVDANLSAPAVMGASVEALDEAVFGAYDSENDDTQSSGQKLLMETMKEIENGNLSEQNKRRIEENVRNSKIPSAILQEVLNNPLIDTKIGNDDVEEFASRVFKSNQGIQKSSKIIEKVEQKEEKALQNKRQQMQQSAIGGAPIDYDRIANIVETIVNNKMSVFENHYHGLLNESKQNPFSNVKVLQLKENGSFLMLDTDNNIYECKLTYKGKNKKK